MHAAFLSLYAATWLAHIWTSCYYTSPDARDASLLNPQDVNRTVNQHTKAYSLRKKAICQSISSTLFWCADTYLPHIWSSGYYTGAGSRRGAIINCQTRGEFCFQSLLSVPKTSRSICTLNIYFCIRQQNVLPKFHWFAITQKLSLSTQQVPSTFNAKLWNLLAFCPKAAPS